MANKLTDITLKALKPKDASYLKSDGAGLNIKVYPNGRKQWVFRKSSNGKAMQICLGDYPQISLKEARELAAKEAAGYVDARKFAKGPELSTFGEIYTAWYNDTKTDLRPNTLRTYRTIRPHLEPLFPRKMDSITALELKALASKVRTTAPSYVGRVVNIVASVELYAHALGLVEVPKLQFVSKTLPTYHSQNRRSIDPNELEALFKTIKEHDPSIAHIRNFLILMLTINRTYEAVNLVYDWVDFNEGVIHYPKSVMKGKADHNVPICKELDYLLKMGGQNSGYVLRAESSKSKNKSFSAHYFGYLFINLGIIDLMSPHGVRALARTWFAKQGFDFAASEMCLAHKVENSMQAAYQRSDYLEQRRPIMEAWGAYVAQCARPYFPELFPSD